MSGEGNMGKPEWSTGENRKSERIQAIFDALETAYPDARLILHFSNPFELLCAAILAARATDKKVNEVTPELFQNYPTPQALAQASFEDVAEIVRPTGYYRQKARRLIEVSQQLVEKFQGKVPKTVEELTILPGVGRKTAIMVINHAYGIPAGIVVDTHVFRIAQRLDWSHQKNTDKMEHELRQIIPEKWWIRAHDLLSFHGRAHCKAPKPKCAGCPIDKLCYSPDKTR